ncbi:hypothetical protein Pfo_013888 [Paulownia fortunei]|nr:hypothetical protein Pfo_013888 [Paulownia fortunei]
MMHEENSLNSSHNIAVKHYHDLMNPLQHIEKVIDKQSMELVAKNCLRLKVSIDVARLYAFQCIDFRAHNECLDSHNQPIVLENAPQNAFYTCPQIQKEILSLYASRIQRFIREEIGDAKYCLIVDESRDELKREQMAIVLWFVDKEGFILERFFDVVHVEDTKTSTLKREISGQGYDGVSTMREEWNGLQTIFLNECPYAYYVHCFAHHLQLTLVATAQSVIPIEHFFSYLSIFMNLVDLSSKRHDQLKIANAIRIVELTSINELETGKGKNQIGIIQCPRDTQWGSHLRSLLSLLDMFDLILHVLSEIINVKSSLSTKASVDGAYDIMTSFAFVFILHFMVELLKMTNNIYAVANIKELVQKFRENRWDQLFDEVKSFCEKHEIDVLNMNALRQSEKLHTKYQLELFEVDIQCNIYFENVSTLSELLIKLIMTLLISTATTERTFLSMKFVKTRLENKMEDDFLASSLLIYIKKEIAQTFSIDSIINEFDIMKKYRA